MPEEEKDKKDDDKVILKVDMHCEACKEKVRKSLRGFPGLEKIEIDMKAQRVTVKGRVDVKKLYEQVKKRCGKRTQLLYPDLKKLEEKKKEEKKTEAETKKEEPPDITVVLKVKMHCGGCAKEVRSSVMKMDGVNEVIVDANAEEVIVKGKSIDPKKVCDRVMKKTGKHAEIVPPPPPPPPPPKEEKPEEKKEEKKEEPKEEKKEEKPEEKKEEKVEEKKEEKPEENKEEKKEGSAEENKEETKEEKKEEAKEEEKKEEKKEEEAKKEEKKEESKEVEIKTEIKKSEYMPMRIISEYEYPPQLFSDENPNACSIM